MWSSLRALSLIIAVTMVPLTAFSQNTLHVPAAHPTIQSAIVASLSGDTVIVAPGMYVENINLLGKAITVRSSGGASVTVINGNQAGTVVTFASNEPQATVLDGFTITNGLGATVGGTSGTSSDAGGIQCSSASPTIRRCIITGNVGGFGGTYVNGTAVTGRPGGPGGILAYGSSLRLIDCDVTNNLGGNGSAGSCGAGATGGTFSGVAGSGGSGGSRLVLNSLAGAPEITRCRFTNNLGGAGGVASCTATVGAVGATGGRGGTGGLELNTSALLVLTQVVIASNLGGNGGAASGTSGVSAGFGAPGGFELSNGGLFVGNVPVALVSCAIVNNVGGNAAAGPVALGGDGGGIATSSSLTTVSTTVAGNVSGSPVTSVLFPTSILAGGLSIGGASLIPSSASFTNCILWGNTRAGLASDLVVSGLSCTVTTSDIGVATGTISGFGPISANPLFVNLAGGDVHLTAGSPCIHTGSPLAGPILFDYEGDPRTVGYGTDMGADEFDSLVGSREDFTLSILVNGTFAAAVNPSTAPAGSSVAVQVMSPGGTLVNNVVYILGEFWAPTFPPIGPAPFPDVHLSMFNGVLASYASIGAGGVTLTATVPIGLAGQAFRVQAFCLTPTALNGIFASSAARDLIF